MGFKHKITILLLSAAICMAFMISSNGVESSVASDFVIDSTLPKCSAFFCFLPVYDTVYVESDRYVEIDLEKQRAYLIKRDGVNDTFKISSGNPNVQKGIGTTPGIFTVQNKTPLAISKQFNNAEMFNWIGFNGNIGFHGLKGTGYYSTLGFRPSSHGCVRIGREDGERLYKLVRRGTPVLVHNGTPARIFAFLDTTARKSNYLYLTGKFKWEKKYLDGRIKNIYSGNAINNMKTRLILDGQTILRGSNFQSGDFNKIPARQKDLKIMLPEAQISGDFTKTNIYLRQFQPEKDSSSVAR